MSEFVRVRVEELIFVNKLIDNRLKVFSFKKNDRVH